MVGQRTRDIMIENVIFFGDIVNELLGVIVDDQNLPLFAVINPDYQMQWA